MTTLVADNFGSKNKILITVGGNRVIYLNPSQLNVVSGEYLSEVELSSPTDQDEFQVQVEFTTLNFDYSRYLESTGLK